MSRKFSCLFLTVAMIISSLVIANAAQIDTQTKAREEAYASAVSGVSEIGVRSSATQRITESNVMAVPVDTGVLTQSSGLSLNELSAIAQTCLDEQIRAEEAAAAEEAARKEILSTYDGVMLNESVSVHTGPGADYPVVRSINGGKVAHLTGGDGAWFAVSYGSSTGYVAASACTPVQYADYEGTAATSTVREDLVTYARTFLGTPYAYGGASRSGTDCSGFTMQVFAEFGYSLPHGASDQYYCATPVSSQERQAGDLVFFNTEGGISHVGLYIGGGAFIHASTSQGVIISYLGESYYAARYVGAGRIVND